MMGQLVELADKYDKQVIFTTHNPAVLDALDLENDEQRLFVTERGKDGATRVRRVAAPSPSTATRGCRSPRPSCGASSAGCRRTSEGAPVPSFAILAEGVTDQAVMENILLGYFGDEDEEPVVTYVQPPRDTKAAPGGWTLVQRVAVRLRTTRRRPGSTGSGTR